MSAEPSTYRSIWSDLYLVPFTQGWIDAGGIKTRYARAGTPGKPVVMMLHGTGGSWDGFAPTLGPLSEHFDCYAFDLVGCGFSGKPDVDYEIPVYVDHVRAFMDAVGVKRASFIGVSLGSWVAARFALTYPERTDRMVLQAAAGLFANPANMARIRAQRLKAVEDPRWENMQAIFNKLLHQEKNRIPDLTFVRLESYKDPEMRKAMDHILALQDYEIRKRNLISEDEWRKIAAPTLLIEAVDDPDEYLETARQVSKLMQKAKLAPIPHVGHWPHFEDPKTFNKLAIDFFRGA